LIDLSKLPVFKHGRDPERASGSNKNTASRRSENSSDNAVGSTSTSSFIPDGVSPKEHGKLLKQYKREVKMKIRQEIKKSRSLERERKSLERELSKGKISQFEYDRAMTELDPNYRRSSILTRPMDYLTAPYIEGTHLPYEESYPYDPQQRIPRPTPPSVKRKVSAEYDD